MEFILALIVGVAAYLCFSHHIKSTYGSEGDAHPFTMDERSRLSLTIENDHFIREYTTMVHHPRADDNNENGTPFGLDI